MQYEYQDNMPQNSIGEFSNGVFQLIGPHQVFPDHLHGYPIPIPFCAIPQGNPLTSQNQVQMFPVQYFHQNKPQNTHINRPKYFHDQYSPAMRMSRSKPSPVKSPVIPLKRHKFNEAQANDIESPKSDSSGDSVLASSSSSHEGVSGLEVDSIFYELQCFASNGCTFAEGVAQNYRKRPCFKKIELLLSRLKQELNVHHNIVSNINSQGTAWAIKDFIFVFSRIVNAWIIMRGYIYDMNKGLDDLRKDYDPNFSEAFIEWQEATMKMMKALMGTVENLDVLTQNKSGNKEKKKEVYVDVNSESKQYEKEFLDNFQKELFTPKSAENSEELQLRNHQTKSYFRAGYLKPLQINPNNSTSSSMCPSSTPTTPDTDALNWLSYEDLNDFHSTPSSTSERLYNRKSFSLPATPMDHRENSFDASFKSRAKKDLSAKFNSMGPFNRDIEAELEKEFGKLDINIDENDDEDKRLEKMYKKDSCKVIYLINEVTKLSHDDSFTVGINLIVENIKNGKYSSLNSILDEFKVLVKHAKCLAENGKGDKASLKKFVDSLEAIINRKAFEKFK